MPSLTKVSFFAIFLLFLSINLNAQENLEAIFQSSNNYHAIIKQGEQYFKQKHPTVSFRQLTQGKYRDGEFVKFLRWQSFWKNSLNPDGTLGDISAYWVEKNQQKAAGRNNSESPYQAVAWTNLSYENYIRGQIGLGRTTSMAFHPTNPDIFYVGAAVGGIWKTTDGGQTYIPLGDDLPFLAVSSIVVDKNNPNVIYIAISDHLWYGLPGIGVYKSVDGGLSWNATDLSFNMADNIRIYHIESDPTDANKMFIATQDGLYKTTDGFNTVTKVNNINSSHVKINLGNSNIVYLTSNNGEFLKSTDGGTIFSLIQDFGNRNLYPALTALNPSKVYLRYQNTLYKSTDNGSTFSETPNAFNRQNNVLHFAPANDQILLTGDFDIQRSDDGGTSFYPISHWLGENNLPLIHVDQRNIFHNPLETNFIYFCNDGGIYRYSISSNQFENLSDGLMITQFYDIAVSQTDKNVIGGGSQDNGNVYRDTDGTWYDYAPTGDGMNQEIDPTNAAIRYWSYQHGGLNRWENGANTSIVPPIQEEEGAWEMPYRLDYNNPNRVIAGYERVYESLNKGNNWTDISGNIFGGSLHELAIAKTNPNRIYVSRNNSLFVKDTLSNNWTAKNMPSFISDLEVAPNDANTIYITTPGFSAGSKVYKSTNAGDTWTNISGSLPNVSTDAIEIYETMPGGLFVGTDAGVYYKDDNLADWVEYGALPHTRVEDIEIQYAEKLIRIGTYGRGVLEAPIEITPCETTSPDTDNDGVCDLEDTCPNFDNNLIGMPCDDGDAETFGEYYTSNCTCEEVPSSIIYCAGAGRSGTGADWINNVSLHTLDNSSGKTGYSNFRQQSTTLMPDSSYNLKVTINYSFPLDTTYAWIDWDTNGIFEVDELINMPTGEGSSYVNEATITVPSGVGPLVTTMRVRVSYGDRGPAEPCGDIYGEVEDYTIRVIPVPTTSPCETTSPDADNDGVCDSEDTCPNFDDNLIGMPCDDGDAETFGEYYTSNCTCEEVPSSIIYCAGAGRSGTGADWINNVSLHTLDNSSGKTGYSNFRQQSTTLMPDSSYNLKVTINYSFPLDTTYAWIDWDTNGVFEAHELISMPTGEGSNYVNEATITVPSGVGPLVTTMRVRVSYGDRGSAEPCGDIYGEVEDYTIRILPAPALPTSTVLDFDGIDDYLDIQDGLIDGMTDFTIETWFYYEENPTSHYSLFDLGKDWNARINMQIKPNDFTFQISNWDWDNSRWVGSIIQSDSIPCAGSWHHAAISYQSDIRTAKLYLNGIEVGVKDDIVVEPQDLFAKNELYIGRSHDYQNNTYFKGKMDEFRVWSYARSEAQIKETKDLPLSGNEAGLQTYYDFEEGTPEGDNTNLSQITSPLEIEYNATFHGFALTGQRSNFLETERVATNITCYEPPIFSDNTVMDFNGLDDYLRIKQGLLDTISDFTIETWFYLDQAPNPVFTIWGLGTSQSRIFLGMNSSLFRFRIVERGGPEEIFSDIDLDVVPSYNTWHHVAVTYHSASKTATLYLDGAVLGSNTDMQLEPKDLSATDSLLIGYSHSLQNNHNNLDGKIDEFRFWSYARSADQIATARNCSLSGTEENLIIYYDFEEGIQNENNTTITAVANKTSYDFPAEIKNITLSGSKSNYIGASSPFLDGICPSLDNNNCQLSTLFVMGSTNKSGVYHGIDTLYSSAVIPADSSMIFKAGATVILNPGFHTKLGAALEVSIESCNLSPIVPEEIATTAQIITEEKQPDLSKTGQLALQISPNPFRHTANIRFYLPEETMTHIFITNLNGQLLTEQKIVNDKGWHQTTLAANELKAGIYLITLQTASQQITKKVMLLK